MGSWLKRMSPLALTWVNESCTSLSMLEMISLDRVLGVALSGLPTCGQVAVGGGVDLYAGVIGRAGGVKAVGQAGCCSIFTAIQCLDDAALWSAGWLNRPRQHWCGKLVLVPVLVPVSPITVDILVCRPEFGSAQRQGNPAGTGRSGYNFTLGAGQG